MNLNQILISVIDGFDKKPQEVINLLESVKAEYYKRMHTIPAPTAPVKTKVEKTEKKDKKPAKKQKRTYNVSPERREQLREWARNIQKLKGKKKSTHEVVENTTEPTESGWTKFFKNK
jgi:hypothetical protein